MPTGNDVGIVYHAMTHRQLQRNEPAFDRRTRLSQITGVDITQVPG